MVLNGRRGNVTPAASAEPNEFRLDRATPKSISPSVGGRTLAPAGLWRGPETWISIERRLERMADIRISESVHGPAEARRDDYVPTYTPRGLTRSSARVHAGGLSARSLWCRRPRGSLRREVGQPHVGVLDAVVGQGAEVVDELVGGAEDVHARTLVALVDGVVVGARPDERHLHLERAASLPATRRISSKRSRMLYVDVPPVGVCGDQLQVLRPAPPMTIGSGASGCGLLLCVAQV